MNYKTSLYLNIFNICVFICTCVGHLFFFLNEVWSLVAQFALELSVAEDDFELDLQSLLAFRGD